jgi:glycosyltransferase involved in cell wall biosynthesis
MAKCFGRLRFIFVCRSLIRRFRPDLVQVHFMDPTLNVLGWAHTKPLLVSVWGSDVAMPRNAVNELFRRYGLRSADIVTATNPLLEYMVRSHVGLSAKVEVIPFGIDLDLFQPGFPPPRTPFRIGFVKHLEPVYGYDILIKAAALMHREIGSMELVIVGGGSRLNHARGLVQELGINDMVSFLGRVPNDQLPGLLGGFHALAMPSLSESFGVSALEASACGVPVVASRTGGIPDVVRDGETGFLVPPRDPAALAERLAWLAGHPSEASRMGAEGRRFVERHYNWTACAERMELVQQQLVAAYASKA